MTRRAATLAVLAAALASGACTMRSPGKRLLLAAKTGDSRAAAAAR
ncbi:MAG: hypothetical protein KGM24_02160 [Elusimicrobia bacterium]|nr:hypothetical protein [Elusimicrobiota bacterium]